MHEYVLQSVVVRANPTFIKNVGQHFQSYTLHSHGYKITYICVRGSFWLPKDVMLFTVLAET